MKVKTVRSYVTEVDTGDFRFMLSYGELVAALDKQKGIIYLGSDVSATGKTRQEIAKERWEGKRTNVKHSTLIEKYRAAGLEEWRDDVAAPVGFAPGV